MRSGGPTFACLEACPLQALSPPCIHGSRCIKVGRPRARRVRGHGAPWRLAVWLGHRHLLPLVLLAPQSHAPRRGQPALSQHAQQAAQLTGQRLVAHIGLVTAAQIDEATRTTAADLKGAAAALAACEKVRLLAAAAATATAAAATQAPARAADPRAAAVAAAQRLAAARGAKS